jgi:hypothetical protein
VFLPQTAKLIRELGVVPEAAGVAKAVSAQLKTVGTFAERFLAEFDRGNLRQAIEQDHGALRRRAAKVLLGIPWQFIPVGRCQRRAIVGLRGLFLICNCLDVLDKDEPSSARPGAVELRQIYWAWKAAGFENWLKRISLRQLREHADREVLAQHPDLLAGAIMSRFA